MVGLTACFAGLGPRREAKRGPQGVPHRGAWKKKSHG